MTMGKSEKSNIYKKNRTFSQTPNSLRRPLVPNASRVYLIRIVYIFFSHQSVFVMRPRKEDFERLLTHTLQRPFRKRDVGLEIHGSRTQKNEFFKINTASDPQLQIRPLQKRPKTQRLYSNATIFIESSMGSNHVCEFNRDN